MGGYGREASLDRLGGGQSTARPTAHAHPGSELADPAADYPEFSHPTHGAAKSSSFATCERPSPRSTCGLQSAMTQGMGTGTREPQGIPWRTSGWMLGHPRGRWAQCQAARMARSNHTSGAQATEYSDPPSSLPARSREKERNRYMYDHTS